MGCVFDELDGRRYIAIEDVEESLVGYERVDAKTIDYFEGLFDRAITIGLVTGRLYCPHCGSYDHSVVRFRRDDVTRRYLVCSSCGDAEEV